MCREDAASCTGGKGRGQDRVKERVNGGALLARRERRERLVRGARSEGFGSILYSCWSPASLSKDGKARVDARRVVEPASSSAPFPSTGQQRKRTGVRYRALQSPRGPPPSSQTRRWQGSPPRVQRSCLCAPHQFPCARATEAKTEHTLGDDANSALSGPAKKDLRRRLAVLLCDLGNLGVLEEGGSGESFGVVDLEEGLGAEGGVGGEDDTKLLGECDHGGLGEVAVLRFVSSRAEKGREGGNERVVLDLEDRGLDARVTEEVNHEASAEVGDTNFLGEAGVLDLLHDGPGRRDGVVGEGDGSALGSVPPLGRVASLNWNVFEGDGEVDEVCEGSAWARGGGRERGRTEVKVVESPVGKLLLARQKDVFLGMERVPAHLVSSFPLHRSPRTHQSLLVTKTSSRVTTPSLIARARPSPHSFSFP